MQADFLFGGVGGSSYTCRGLFAGLGRWSLEEIAGELSRVSLLKVMEEVESRQWTGVLQVEREGVEKRFFLQQGRVVFVTSTQAGERFGEYLLQTGCLDAERMQFLVEESRRRGVRFTYDLIAEKVFAREELERALYQLVVSALADALNWTRGLFNFSPGIPESILKGPVHISVEGALNQAVALIMAED